MRHSRARSQAGTVLALLALGAFAACEGPFVGWPLGEEDTVAPMVVSTSPSDQGTEVPLAPPVRATFSEPMDRETLSSSTFFLVGNGTPVAGSISYDERTVTLQPNDALDPLTRYTATITTGARDLVGLPLNGDYVWTFTTGSGVDDTPPRVSATTPLNGAVGSPSEVPLTVTFSEDMAADTLSAASFRLFDGPVLIEGAVRYVGRTGILDPVAPLDSFVTYTARVAETVADLAGNTLEEEYVWSFTTGFVPDTTAPVITSTAPADDEALVPINTQITAIFSEIMDPLSIDASRFLVRVGEDPVAGMVTTNGAVATFTPDASLRPAATYDVTMRAEVSDLAGNPMGLDRTWRFETGLAPDRIRPVVTSVAPRVGAVFVPANRSLAALFTEPMDAATLTTASFTLRRLDQSIVGSVANHGVTSTFRPNSALAPLTTYAATITTEARDLAGNAVAQSFVWNVHTALAPDLTRPHVVQTHPGEADSGVALGTSIVFAFSEPMDASTINSTTFRVVDPLGVAIEGAVFAVGPHAVFVPRAPLQSETTYGTLVTTGALDLAGNGLTADHTGSFTTGTSNDTVPLNVTRLFPDHGDVNVARNLTLSAHFDEAVHPMSIHNLRFRLLGPGQSPVDGMVELRVDGTIATFTPHAVLLAETEYVATLSGSVRDLSGNGMIMDRTWVFQTGALADAVPPVQLGSLVSFAAFATSGLTNTNTEGTTSIHGDVGIHTTGMCMSDGAACTNVSLPVDGGRYELDTVGVTTQAFIDLELAYADMTGRPPGAIVDDLESLTLAPGIYTTGSDLGIAVGGTLRLDANGDADAVWIFQAGGTITVNNGATIELVNGASASNVFWVTASSVILGSEVVFMGTAVAAQSASAGAGSTVSGRLLCLDGALNLTSNVITLPPM